VFIRLIRAIRVPFLPRILPVSRLDENLAILERFLPHATPRASRGLSPANPRTVSSRNGSVAKRHTKGYNLSMKAFLWNEEKNTLLKAERQVSFEEIVLCIGMGFLLDVLEHPNQEKYKGQKIFAVQVDNYVYLVPFIETESEIFLKTIIPSRKATRKYLKGSAI
jgi:uncharacterized DUF497 family protein